MIDQKTLDYHRRFVEPTKKELKEEVALAENKMIKHLQRCKGLTDISLENLHEHLRVAMMLELSTIPPYLTALYSIENGDSSLPDYKENFGDNAEVGYIIRSVMMEEMLHFTLVGNILNATKGKVMINDDKYVPEYPTAMPDSASLFLIHISKMDRDAIKTFLRIEQPTPANTPPRLDGYTTIGQFYHAIIILMEQLEEEARQNGGSIFHKRSHQIDKNYYYGGGGEIIPVKDLDSAKKAIEIILEQGEGSEDTIYDDDDKEFDQIRELAHYFKFNEIYEEQRYADCQINPKEPPQGTRLDVRYDKVYNMGIDPKTEDFESEDLKRMSHEFNYCYRLLLDDLQDAFTKNQSKLLEGVANMYKMRYKAVELMKNPIPCKKVNAGPTFEFLSDAEIIRLKKRYRGFGK